MKKLLVATLAVAALSSGSAIAADIPLKAPPPVVVYDWSGIYFGTRSGGAWAHSKDSWTVTDHYFLAGTAVSQDASGYSFGGHVGIQKQFDHMVLGIEAAWDGYNRGFLHNTSFGLTGAGVVPANSPCTFAVAGNGTPCGVQDRLRDTWQVVGRLGYATNRMMGYVLGGWASTRVQVTESLCCNPVGQIQGDPFGAGVEHSSTSTVRHGGAVVGAGAEVAVTDTLILGIEYNHLFLDTRTHSSNIITQFCACAPNAPLFMQKDMRADVDRFMGRMSYKFGWGGGPLVARY